LRRTTSRGTICSFRIAVRRTPHPREVATKRWRRETKNNADARWGEQLAQRQQLPAGVRNDRERRSCSGEGSKNEIGKTKFTIFVCNKFVAFKVLTKQPLFKKNYPQCFGFSLNFFTFFDGAKIEH
jgi:hypothetical protein